MRWALPLIILLLWKPSPSETIPALRAQSLADVQVDLPADLHGRIGVLVIGFSKKSASQTKRWADLLLLDFGNDTHVAFYQGAVLAEVPAFIRGMVVKGIRSKMSPAERAHFVPILQDVAEWRQAARFTSSDEAYILVIDSAGQIKWRAHGVETPEAYGHLKECVAELQKATAGKAQQKP